jgi:hypothetical protein
LALSLFWYLSFGVGKPTTGEARIDSARAPASLSYYEDGPVSIRATNEADALRALGYQTGRDHGWTAVFLRQSALGRLSEWFGSPVLDLDRFARKLGFASLATSSMQELSPQDAELLAAYADGLNRALQDKDVALGNEFVLFDIRPEHWEPWHSLAVERLVAWVANPPLPVVRGDSLLWTAKPFEEADREFRTWLRLHGAEMSAVWSWSDSLGTRFSARYVYGATTHPILSPVSMSWPDITLSGLNLVGTPFFPLLNGPGGLRVTLLSSDRNLEIIEIDPSTPLTPRFERIADDSGDEHLVTVQTLGDLLILGPDPDIDGDSLIQGTALRWSGLTSGSDWPMWRQIALSVGSNAAGDPARQGFQLMDGDGLATSLSSLSVLGSPSVSLRARDRIFVSNGGAARFAGEQFLRLGNIDVEQYTTASEWASENAPRALSLVAEDSTFDAQTIEAIEYLRNWDHRYENSSIGASIFDGWMHQHRDKAGEFPTIEVPRDSSARRTLSASLRDALVAAIDSMTARGGPDLARWRLEYFRPGTRFYPVWDYPPLIPGLAAIAEKRYAPIDIPQPGHPTTMAWQPGLHDEPANSPSHVVVQGVLGDATSLTVRPDYVIGSGIIARYVAGPPSRSVPIGGIPEYEVVLMPGHRDNR